MSDGNGIPLAARQRRWRAMTATAALGAAALASVTCAGIGGGSRLIIEQQGSFFVGGEIVHTDAASGTPGGHAFFGGTNAGTIAINQMYVRYQIPEGGERHVPVVLIHGGNLAGTTYETTPDGRMGWDEYFARRGRAVYVPDQAARARSGFDATQINKVKTGAAPASALPETWVIPQQSSWMLFRFGPRFGEAYPDGQFPVGAVDEFAKQVVPDQNAILPTPNPTLKNLAALAVKTSGAILVGHSESGFFPEQAALIDPTGVKGMITIEPGCPTTLTPQQIAVLAKIPTLVVFGDHLDDPSTLDWRAFFRGCQTFVQQLTNAGGDATMLHLPAAGLRGNSHMMMQDRNNLQVADLLLSWIDQHVDRKSVGARR